MDLRAKIRHMKDLWQWCGSIPYVGRVEVKIFACIPSIKIPWLATALFIPYGKPAWAARAPVALERDAYYTLDEVCLDFEEELLRSIPEIRGALEAPEEWF
jgi:hypothetical protein